MKSSQATSHFSSESESSVVHDGHTEDLQKFGLQTDKVKLSWRFFRRNFKPYEIEEWLSKENEPYNVVHGPTC
jgi:hypothetical protein